MSVVITHTTTVVFLLILPCKFQVSADAVNTDFARLPKNCSTSKTKNTDCEAFCEVLTTSIENMDISLYKNLSRQKCSLRTSCTDKMGAPNRTHIDEGVWDKSCEVDNRVSNQHTPTNLTEQGPQQGPEQEKEDGTNQDSPEVTPHSSWFMEYFYVIVLKQGTSICQRMVEMVKGGQFTMEDLMTSNDYFQEIIKDLNLGRNKMCKQWINATSKAFGEYFSNKSSSNTSMSVGMMATFLANMTKNYVIPKSCNSIMRRNILNNIVVNIHDSQNNTFHDFNWDTGDQINISNHVENKTAYKDDTKVIHITIGHVPFEFNTTNDTFVSASDIKAIEVVNNNADIKASLNFHVKFKNIINGSQLRCFFWDTMTNGWSENGVKTQVVNTSFVTCISEHLTTFAVFVSRKDTTQISSYHEDVLKIISLIGCSLSLIAILTTILIYVLLSKEIQLLRTTRYVAHFNLLLSLGFMQATFLISTLLSKHEIGCKIIAALLHYFTLTTFCWMALEGIILYIKVIMVFERQQDITPYLMCAAWGVPLVFVVVTASVHHTGYGVNNICWLTFDDHFVMWAFIIPLGAIFLFDLVIMCLVITTAIQLKKSQTTRQRTMDFLRSLVILSPILGITWFFGILVYTNDAIGWQYAFAISNSIQGLVIFLVYGVGKKELRVKIFRKLCKGKLYSHKAKGEGA